MPKGGGVIFNPKIYVADFGHLYRALSDVFRKETATQYSENEVELEGFKGRLEFFPEIQPFWYPDQSLIHIIWIGFMGLRAKSADVWSG